MKIEKLVALAHYMPSAEPCWDSPDMMGHAAGRACVEALIDELVEYGYRKEAVIEGMEMALAEASPATATARA